MNVDKAVHGDVTVLSVNGALDGAGAIQAEDRLGAAVPDGSDVLLDLTRMSHLSSAGLRVLLLVYRKSRRTGGRLALAGISDDVRSVMSATGLLDAFLVADTVEDGLAVLAR